MTRTPSPRVLWDEAGGDPEKYIALLLQHGITRRLKPGDPPNVWACPVTPHKEGARDAE